MSWPTPSSLRSRARALAGTACGLLALGLPLPLRAQRYVWVVPWQGPLGTPFQGVLWDRGSGTLVAAQGDRILRLDPRDGSSREIGKVLRDGYVPGPDEYLGPLVVNKIAQGPGGEFIVNDYGDPDYVDGLGGKISRVRPGGEVEPLAGWDGGDQVYTGDTEKALEATFGLTDLAVGAGGQVYLADNRNHRVFEVYPRADGKGFGIRTIAGNGDDPVVQEEAEEKDPPQAGPEPALAVAISPQAIARDPRPGSAGDRLAVTGETNRVHLLTRGSGQDGAAWGLTAVAGDGETLGGGEGHDDALDTSLNDPHQLAWGEDGTLYVLTQDLLWALKPPLAPGDGPWSSQAIAGRRAKAGEPLPGRRCPIWPGQPAQGFNGLHQMRHMAAVPGGGLLLTDGAADALGPPQILFIGPESDISLAQRVAAHQKAESEGNWSGTRDIREGLARLHRLAANRNTTLFDAPFRSLARAFARDQGHLVPGLARDAQRLIGSFLLDHRVAAFRFRLALHAIQAGSPFESAWCRAAAQFEALPAPEALESKSGPSAKRWRTEADERKDGAPGPA